MQWSKAKPRSRAQSSSFCVPLIAGPSSSPVMRKEMAPPKSGPAPARNSLAAATMAAMPPFMSTAPRPIEPAVRPPRRRRAARSRPPSSPGGTTSVWPANTRCGRPLAERGEEVLDVRRAGLGEGDAVHGEAERRERARRAESSAPPSAGVTERAAHQIAGEGEGVDGHDRNRCGAIAGRLAGRGRRCRGRSAHAATANAAGAASRCAGDRRARVRLPPSIPQQLVDRGLGAGLLVDPLDDHRAIERRARRRRRAAACRAWCRTPPPNRAAPRP